MRYRGAIVGSVVMAWMAVSGPNGATAGQSNATLPGWLAGCWTGARGAERFTERWVAADATTLLGVAHTLKDGRLSAFEFLRVVVRGDRLVYIAQPNGVPPTEFTAPPADQTPTAITFGNPQHDFPKRVGYLLTGVKGLTAWIDGGDAGGSRIEYAMTRVACEP